MRDRQCALNHDAIESAAIVSSVINKPTTLSCVYHLSTDDLQTAVKQQCANCIGTLSFPIDTPVAETERVQIGVKD